MHDTAVELLYRYALVLIVEARDYEAAAQALQHAKVSNLEQLALEAERLRVTTRLLEAMGWLMAQKGAAAGEITGQEAASDRFAPGNVVVCFGRTSCALKVIPKQLGRLLDCSLSLYLEVVRIALGEPETV